MKKIIFSLIFILSFISVKSQISTAQMLQNINDTVYQNSTHQITGTKLNGILRTMVHYTNGHSSGGGGGDSINGTANYIPLFVRQHYIGNSWLYQSGSNLKITDSKIFSSANGNSVLDFGSGNSTSLYTTDGTTYGLFYTAPSYGLNLQFTLNSIGYATEQHLYMNGTDGMELSYTSTGGTINKINIDSTKIKIDASKINVSQGIANKLLFLNGAKNLKPIYLGGGLSLTDSTLFATGSGTVTSVAALTLGTTGTDLSSTVANSTTTPVITLNVPTASATNRGVLSSTDWSTFNNKGSGTITSIATTAPVLGGTITTTGTISVDTSKAQGRLATYQDNFLKAPKASPTFTGTVTIPTPFTLGATSVTSTGTQLNYLNAATGTTGTTSSNLVYSISPNLVTPILGTPTSGTLTNCTGLPNTAITGAWIDWSASDNLTGYSSTTVHISKYFVVGKTLFYYFEFSGTSNTNAITITLPNTSVAAADNHYALNVMCTNSGTASTTPGAVQVTQNSTTLNVYRDRNLTTWTATGTKTVLGSIIVEIQ